MLDLKKAQEHLKKQLGSERFSHCLRVSILAKKLAQFWKENQEKAEIAGLLHDCSRYAKGTDLIVEAKKYGLAIKPEYHMEPKLCHAPLAAKIAQKIYMVKDKDILNAIRYHTLGRKNMSLLEKIIYIADHMEPARNHLHVAVIRKMAYKNLDKAIAMSTSSMIEFLLREEKPIAKEALETRNYYMEKAK